MRDGVVTLPGGRTLAFTDLGAPGRACVLFCHGAPMSRLHLVPHEAAFAAHGLRVITPDRPGYGGSSPQPGRSMADWATDVAAVADALGIDRFVVAGHSSGGPYAIACCALLGGRATAGVVLGGVTDMAWPPAWDGYIESEAALMRAPDERTALAWCRERYGDDGSGFLAEPFALPEADAAHLADPRYGDALTTTMTEAFRQGVVGYAQDAFVQARPWPFDPGCIAVPVVVAHGALDTLIPEAHSRHTAALIPGAVLRILPGHGHMSIVSELPALAADLLRRV